jgi:hypothetical protein
VKMDAGLPTSAPLAHRPPVASNRAFICGQATLVRRVQRYAVKGQVNAGWGCPLLASLLYCLPSLLPPR